MTDAPQSSFTGSVEATAEMLADRCFDRNHASEGASYPAVLHAITSAIEGAIERCARVVDINQETYSETPSGTERHVTPRMRGNLAGLAYAAAIRALNPGAALAEPTTVDANTYDGVDARPNRKLDSSDRGHPTAAQAAPVRRMHDSQNGEHYVIDAQGNAYEPAQPTQGGDKGDADKCTFPVCACVGHDCRSWSLDRGELILFLQDLASPNLTKETADRQARRMADALIAKGVNGIAPIAWIAFAGNGNIRFWTADEDRAKREKEGGMDLRAFTLAELVTLAGRPRYEAGAEAVMGTRDPAYALPKHFADAYIAARKMVPARLADEIVSRNCSEGDGSKMDRIDGETDAEFVRRIVATYLAVSSTDRTFPADPNDPRYKTVGMGDAVPSTPRGGEA